MAGCFLDPAAFVGAADQAARNRSATVISAHLADQIINVVTVIAPDQYAAAAVARAVFRRAQAPGPATAWHRRRGAVNVP